MQQTLLGSEKITCSCVLLCLKTGEKGLKHTQGNRGCYRMTECTSSSQDVVFNQFSLCLRKDVNARSIANSLTFALQELVFSLGERKKKKKRLKISKNAVLENNRFCKVFFGFRLETDKQVKVNNVHV